MIHMIIFAAASSPFQRKDGLASGKLLKKKQQIGCFTMFYLLKMVIFCC